MKISDYVESQIKGLWGTDFDENGIPVIKTNNLTYEGHIDYSDICKRNITEEQAKEWYLRPGDLLIEKSGGTKTHSVGYVSYFEGEEDKYVCNNFILALRPKNTINSKFLFYQIQFKYESNQFSDCFNKTTGIQNLKVKDYLAKEIKIYTPEEQEKIVSELDTVRSIINKNKQILEKYEILIKSRFIEMFGDLKQNSKNWQIKNFKECAKIDTNMVKDFEKYADYPHIGIDSIEKETGKLSGYRTVKEDNVISGKYLFTPEHIIYSKIRPNLNKVAMPDFYGVCSADAYPILVDKEICSKEFFTYVLRSDFYLSYILAFSSRTNMPKVNKEQVESFNMPVPPIELQNDFAAFVQQIDKSKFAVQKSLEKTEILYKSLMQAYFG